MCSDSLKTEFSTDLEAVWIDTINIGRFLDLQRKPLKNQPGDSYWQTSVSVVAGALCVGKEA